MAKHVWTILCTKASIDKQSNNLSLYNVIEKLTVHGPQPPTPAVVPIQLELATLWTRSNHDEPETGTERVSFMAPSGQVHGGGEIAVELIGKFIRTRTVIRMNGLPMSGPGVYEFIVEFQRVGETIWTEVGRLPLEVEYGEPEE